MNNKELENLTDNVRAAKPDLRPSALEWVKSRRGQQVLGRVLAELQTPASVPSAKSAPAGYLRPWRQARTGLRVAIAAGLLVVVCLAVLLPLALCGLLTGQATVVDSPQTAAPTGEVSVLAAVERVMDLDCAIALRFAESVGGPSTTDQASLLATAIERGLVTSSEISGQAAAEPISRGRYAVLLWNTFGPLSPVAAAPTTPVTGATDPAESEAIRGLQAAGIIREMDGAFLADQALSSDLEQLLLSRIEYMLTAQAPQ